MIVGIMVLFGIGLAVAFHLLLTQKGDLGRAVKKGLELETELNKLKAEWMEERLRIAGQLLDVQSQAQAGLLASAPVSAPASTGLYGAKRGQAMRLLTKGSEVEEIAADLQLPKNEIRLLHKVQKILVNSSQPQ